ncbi:MAG: molybdopterin biosynthesis protein [Candidatus Methanodesulfokora sp.]
MERVVFRSLVSLEEALRIAKENFFYERGVEEVEITEALNRVLAQDVHAEVDIPPFDRATKDGYAVRAEDTYGATETDPRKLSVIGCASAGHPFNGFVEKGCAVEISTGAPIPSGANSVVMEEYTSREGDEVLIFRAVSPGENIQGVGTDIRLGETVLRKGTVLGPREIGVLAAMGLKKVRVFSRPKVAIISTGDELSPPGSPLDFGKIYDVNSYTIYSSVLMDGCLPIHIGIAKDDLEEILSALRKAVEAADFVIISGSTSVGAGDVIYKAINETGRPGVLVHGLAVHPGKPAILGRVGKKLVFGLPGFPTSSLMIYKVLVSPVLREASGMPIGQEEMIRGKVARRITKESGRRSFLPVGITRDTSGGFLVFPPPTGSESITTLTNFDGFVEVPENVSFLEEGEEVTIRLFGTVQDIADVSIIGSHCIGLEKLMEMVRERERIRFKVVSVGSFSGFAYIRSGEADISGVHAYDEESKTYNITFLDKYKIRDFAVLVSGYRRLQGFILQKGNPKGFSGIEDLLSGRFRLINRNRGSGTRALLDSMLKDLAERRGVSLNDITNRINGYWYESKTHNGVASAIKHGLADVGIGIEAVARYYDLDFIPISHEDYDFLIRKDRMEKRGVRIFMDVLRSDEARSAISSIPGIIPKENMGEVLSC